MRELLHAWSVFDRAARRKVGEPPCRGCQTRTPGCRCEQYAAWVDQLRAERAALRLKEKDSRFRPF